MSLLFLREESCWQQYLSSYLQEMNLAICDTPHQTHCVENSIFQHFVMVMTVLWAELWFVVVCQALFFSDGDVGIKAMEISRASPPTKVICFLYS
jgi:hypothetical protein